MREADSYRSARRKRKREDRKQQRDLERMARNLTPEQARKALGIWAATGGKVNILTKEGVH